MFPSTAQADVAQSSTNAKPCRIALIDAELLDVGLHVPGVELYVGIETAYPL